MSGNRKYVIIDWDGTVWNSYNPPFGPYPEAAECLRQIRELSDLSLLTAGNDSGQWLKIVTSGFADCFDRFRIVPTYEKKREALAEFRPGQKIVPEGFSPKDVIVVGDRIDLEIAFGYELGFTTVRIKRSRSHHCRHYLATPETAAQEACKEISHLSELVDFLKSGKFEEAKV